MRRWIALALCVMLAAPAGGNPSAPARPKVQGTVRPVRPARPPRPPRREPAPLPIPYKMDELVIQPVSNDILPPRKTDPSKPTLTLNDSLRMGLQHPAVMVARTQVKVARADMKIAASAFYPQLALQPQQQWGIDPTDGDQFYTSVAFVLNSTLVDFGQRGAQLSATQANLRAAVLSFQNAWIGQTQQIRAAYAEVLRAEYLVAIQLDSISRSKLNLDSTRGLYLGGVKAMSDVISARVQLSEAIVTYETAQATLNQDKAKLANAIGVPLETVLQYELEDVLRTHKHLPDRAEAIATLNRSHPQLTNLDQQATYNRYSAKAARMNTLPSLSTAAALGVKYGPPQSSAPAPPVFPPPFERLNEIFGGGDNSGNPGTNQLYWTIQVTLNIPIIAANYGPQGDKFDATAEQLTYQRKVQEMLLVQQLDAAIAAINGANKRMMAAADGVVQAIENNNLAYKRYCSGLSDITELVQARGFLNDIRTDFVNALADLRIAQSQYLQSAGEVIVPAPLASEKPSQTLLPPYPGGVMGPGAAPSPAPTLPIPESTLPPPISPETPVPDISPFPVGPKEYPLPQ